MKNYITMSRLVISEGLASQMSNIAGMYAVAKKTGHRILFLSTWTAGKGVLFNAPFESLPVDVISDADMTSEDRIAHVFEIDSDLVVDPRVFELDPGLNYDFKGQLVSYRYWYPVREEIFKFFRFKQGIVDQAAALIAGLGANGREIVSLHVRRTDYLDSPHHVTLTLDYYFSACSLFNGDRYLFLVFSDDIEWCKNAFSRRKNFVYSERNSAHVDMCAMSLCDHNIIANSSFSLWGALLNKNPTRKVVCPARFLKEGAGARSRYLNYAWFPDTWIPLDALCA